MSASNKPTNYTLAQTILAGIDKHLAGLTSVTIGGTTYTPATLKAVFQAFIAAMSATAASKGQWQQSVKTEATALSAMQTAKKGLRTYILGAFGAEAVSVYADFGMAAPKPTGQTTVKIKAEAVDQRASTREARHTMGPKQKESIHGTTVEAVPATAPPTGSTVQATGATAPAAPGGAGK